MAVFSLSAFVPAAIGPLLAGVAIDHANPHWVWYAVGVLGILAGFAFLGLARQAERKDAVAPVGCAPIGTEVASEMAGR